MGKKFVIERSIDQIAEKLLKPAPSEDEENAQDADKHENKEEGAVTSRVDSALGSNKEEGAEGEGEEEGEEKKEEWLADVVENDHLEKAAMLPPRDPENE